ncbi:hypothetical protein EDB83DRAFT_1309359 [Lactarius deliciosus]|nr:hypothetical protein EDB83DRAFT_1309359 [Lactarius deliciosus]
MAFHCPKLGTFFIGPISGPDAGCPHSSHSNRPSGFILSRLFVFYRRDVFSSTEEECSQNKEHKEDHLLTPNGTHVGERERTNVNKAKVLFPTAHDADLPSTEVFHCHFLSFSPVLGSHATRTPLTSPFLCAPDQSLTSQSPQPTAAGRTSALSLALAYSNRLALGEDLLRLAIENGPRPHRGGGNAASPPPAHPSLPLGMKAPSSRTLCAVPEVNPASRTAILIDGGLPLSVVATSPIVANRQSPSLR